MKTGTRKYTSLLPRMAITNIRKNASTYLPYMFVSTFAMFTFFVFDLLLKNDVMRNLPKGAYTLVLISIGFVLLQIIMVPFLYYTNSFLIKRRKRELGLYSILGLEKKHIGIMMFWESLALYGIILAAAILLGLVFSRLVFLLLLNLAKLPVNVEFTISPRAISDTALFYAFITGLNLLVNLIQVGKSNPLELMSDSRKGEKEPRFILPWSILGLLAAACGYYLALKAQLESKVFMDFFLAVFLVVIGTYLLFTSGSIAALRFLKRQKKFYYRSENFVTVSGMLYRMKKSAASLSNICIFSTMVIITAVCTVVVYLDMDNIVSSNFRREFEISFFGSDIMDEDALTQKTAGLAEQHQIQIQDELAYTYVKIRPIKEGNVFRLRGEGNNSHDNTSSIQLMTLATYNQMEETEARLAPDEVLLYSTGPDFSFDTVRFLDAEYRIKEELSACKVDKKTPNNLLSIDYFIVFADEEQMSRVSALFLMDSTQSASYFYGFQPVGAEGDKDVFSRELEQYASGQPGFAQYRDYREQMSDEESMYGGLLFIGIFFGAIFLICLLIIMYYKQLTEGFEDQKNFEVMQKVGMSDGEIRRTIRKQISMVFGLPLIGAICHTAVGMRMVYMLLGSIGFFEMSLLIACTAGGCLVFAALYSVSYKRTSMAYYRIVRHMN